MATIRWRLVMGLISFVATVILTAPAMGAARQPDNRATGGLPNSAAAVADVIWPNGAVTNDAIIWPNPIVADDTSGGL